MGQAVNCGLMVNAKYWTREHVSRNSVFHFQFIQLGILSIIVVQFRGTISQFLLLDLQHCSLSCREERAVNLNPCGPLTSPLLHKNSSLSPLHYLLCLPLSGLLLNSHPVLLLPLLTFSHPPPYKPSQELSHPSLHLASSNSNHRSIVTNNSLYPLYLNPTPSFFIQLLNISCKNGLAPFNAPTRLLSANVLSGTLP